MNINKKKKLVAGLSIFSNVTLSILKILAGILTGSLSIISEAIHSMSDLLASVLTFFSVIKSAEPADSDHPYGHGKYEDMAGFIEGLLIIFASFFIVFEATKKIIQNSHIETQSNIGIIVMFIAVIMNCVVSFLLLRVAKESDSVSLYADAEHLRTDIYSSFGVLIGLTLIKITGYTAFDSVVAILIAVLIYRAGYSISKQTLENLLDYSLSEDNIDKIREIVTSFSYCVKLKNNGIKARKSGPSTDIDIVLLFNKDTTICECHKICDEIENKIKLIFKNSTISIHTEPVCYYLNCQSSCAKNTLNKIN